MKEPKRLRQASTDNITKLLLEAGHSDAPSDHRLGRMLGGVAGASVVLGAEAATAAAAASAPVAQSALPLALVVKWLGLGAFAGMIVSAGATQVVAGAPDNASTSISPAVHAGPKAAAPSSPVAASDSPVAAEAVKPEPSPTSPGASPRRDLPRIVSGNVRSIPTAAARAVATAHQAAENPVPLLDPSISPEARALREEVAALGLAKAALNRGAAAEALAIVRSYHTRFPTGRLGPEAAYIEMEAAHATGNLKRARELALQLAGGTTPNAYRARVILEGKAP
jgi:hypothetical protein